MREFNAVSESPTGRNYGVGKKKGTDPDAEVDVRGPPGASGRAHVKKFNTRRDPFAPLKVLRRKAACSTESSLKQMAAPQFQTPARLEREPTSPFGRKRSADHTSSIATIATVSHP